MKLLDRADGVRGHYCIGRLKEDGRTWEFWNRGEWTSSGEVFIGEDKANKKMKSLEHKQRRGGG